MTETPITAAPTTQTDETAPGGAREVGNQTRLKGGGVGTIVEQAGEIPDQAAARKSIDFDQNLRQVKNGDVIQGTVVHVDRAGVLVDVGLKQEGLIPLNELAHRRSRRRDHMVQPGEVLDVYVFEANNPESDQVLLSKWRADLEKAWDKVIEAQKTGEVLYAHVSQRVKGGLVVDLGIRGFVPASHVGNGKPRNLENYVGQELPLKVIEVDREKKKVVLSHRNATEEERAAQRAETLQNIQKGQVRTGVVRRITEYGAFIDIGGVDGLLHVSEMSWSRVKHPSEVLNVGDEVQVMVLNANLEQERISLGIRQTQSDPWVGAGERYATGDEVTGTISRTGPYGLWLQLENGPEGFISNAELNLNTGQDAEEVYQVGDSLQARITELRTDERRLILSAKQAGDEDEGFIHQPAIDDAQDEGDDEA